MVNEQLAVVHALKDFDVRMRTEGKQMFRLRFSDKRFFRAIPEMDVIAGDGFQLVGINGLVAI